MGRRSDLDHPDNRVWILLLNAADALDPVLLEFRLEPAEVPDPGGAHYGLQPPRAEELDPTGTLARLWARYEEAFHRLARAEGRREPEEARDRLLGGD